MPLPRYLSPSVAEDLKAKMVFLAGPRQVGKTTLARERLLASGGGTYLTWDRREDRAAIRKAEWPAGEALVVLDEIHKWRDWKRWIKGEFDKHRGRLEFLVTGSARLDVYRKGGDSLQGRYHHYRLHPFTCAEIDRGAKAEPPRPGEPLRFRSDALQDTVDALVRFGGFPEPFLARSERALRRWQKERMDRFFREDVRDLEAIRDLSSMEILADLIEKRVALPLSANALREDLEASHRAVSHWIDILDRLYFLFRVRPFASKAIRSLKKMPKAYLWDLSLVSDPGARFENLVALHLLKLCHLLEDRDGFRAELFYLRDPDGREVDFLVACDRKPWFAVEAKLSDDAVSPALFHYRDRLKIPFGYQVVLDGRRDYEKDGVRCLPARTFFSGLV
ncbi:MAG: AAA family ATPase [Planctomycetota bacterium]